jgi:hypothetical protein
MRLVPPFNTILSLANKGKYATLIARQAALSSCMGVGTAWEMSTNVLLDRPEPSSKVSLWQLLMNIPSQVFPGKPLFHSLDKQWRSENVVTFCFLPKNKADAGTMIAGLIPYIRDTHDPWYLSAFLTEAKLQHQSSRWDHKTRQVFSAEEAEISDFLTEDDELNHMDIPTEEKASIQPNPDVEVNVPPCTEDTRHHFHEDADSVSTFHPSGASVASAYSRPSAVFQPNGRHIIIRVSSNHCCHRSSGFKPFSSTKNLDLFRLRHILPFLSAVCPVNRSVATSGSTLV